MKPSAFLALLLWPMSLFAQTISWDGGGDGVSWQDPLNWNGDKLPASTESAIINAAQSVMIISKSNVTVRSAQISSGLLITNSEFKVISGASFVNGTLVVSRDSGLYSQQPGTIFSANGPAVLGEGNLFAQLGGHIEFPNLKDHTDGGISFHSRTWQTEGLGSLIRFGALTNITGAIAGQLRILSYGGSRVEFPLLRTTEPGYLQVFAEGSGSAIEMPLLATGPGFASVFEARDGAAILVPLLTEWLDSSLAVRGSNSFVSTAQITLFSNSSFTAAGGTLNLSNVVSAALSSFYVENGTVLSLPNLREYPAGIPIYDNREFRATGVGSVLNLSSLTNVFGGVNGFGGLYIRAYAGGKVLLPGLTTVPKSYFNIFSDGQGSQIDLPNLLNSPGAGSSLQALNGGSLNFPNLIHATNVTLVIRGLETAFALSQITSIANSSLTVDGVDLTFSNITDAALANLYVVNGGRLALPNLHRYPPGIPAFENREFQASGAGSVLDLSGINDLTGGVNGFSGLFIRAFGGGTVLLPGVTRVTPSHFFLFAEGMNSEVSLSNLTHWSGSGNILAREGGTIELTAQSLITTNVTVTLDPSGTISVGELQLFGNSELNGNGTLMADVINGGIVRPGSSPGGITVENYIQLPDGNINVEIGGVNPTTGYDVLNVLGMAYLDGGLNVSRINSFEPPIDSIYRIVNAAEVIGEFFEFTGLIAGSNVEFVPGYNSTNAFLTAQFFTGPVLLTISPSGGFSGSLSFFDAVFNEPIDFGSINSGDVVLTSPSGTVALSSVSGLNSHTARLHFPTQTTPGNYTLIVGPDITDLVGNKMNQDTDGLNGEVTDRFTNVVSLSIGDLTVTNLQLSASGTVPVGTILTASWAVTNRGGLSITSGRNESILLSPNGQLSNSIVIAVFPDLQSLSPAAGAIHQQQFSIPRLGPAGMLFVGVETDSGNFIPEISEANNFIFSTNPIVIPHTLQLQLFPNDISETGASINGLISRNGSIAAPLQVTLATDSTELSAPATVTIPAGQNSAPFIVFPVHDHIADGPQLVPITAGANGYISSSNLVTVLDSDTPRLSLTSSNNSLAEGTVVTATVTRELTSAQPLVVTLVSSIASQLDAPLTVTIPANAASVSFTVRATEDSLIETPRTFSLSATADGHIETSLAFTVRDNDLPIFTLTLSAASVDEGSHVTATISRSFASSSAMILQLNSSIPERVVVPSSVIINAGQNNASFAVSAVNNSNLDGNQMVTISAFPTESLTDDPIPPGASVNLTVRDNDAPSLSLIISQDLVAEGLSNATTATIRRNTPATNALTVILTSSNTNEATVPASIVLSNGAVSASFSIRSINDGVTDGNKVVILTGTANGYVSGSDELVVTDSNLPDLIITSLTVPTNSLTGDNFNIGFREMNLGTSKATGTWSQVVFLSTDPYPGDDEPLTEFTFTGNLPPGLFVERNTQIRSPLVPGDYWIIVTTDVSNRVVELLENNNSTPAVIPIRIDPSFSAVVQTTINTALAGTSIPMTGQATRPGGSPAKFELVNIHINVKGTKRLISAITDGSGNFSATFKPLPGEAGAYTIGAAHPGVDLAPIQDGFNLFGMRFEPANLTNLVLALESVSTSVNLANLADLPLTGLNASVIGANSGIQVTASVGSTIPASGMVPMDIEISSLTDAPLTNVFTVRVTSSQGATADLLITAQVVQLKPGLSSSPSALSAGMRRGGQTIVQFTILNLGGAPSGPLNVLLPNESFMHLSSAPQIDSIPAGGSNTVTLQLLPGTNQAIGTYDGNLIISGAEVSLLIPYSFRSLSEAVGNLVIEAQDEYTFYANGSPRLANAEVTILESISGMFVTNGLTADNGRFDAGTLREGYYDIEVRADNHSTFRRTILTPSGGSTNLIAFLSRQAVRYLWTVIPTDIEDRTRITIETVFEAYVPIPVITVDPPLIDLAELTNEVTQIDLTIRNHGLIAARSMKLNFGSNQDWSFTPLIDDVGSLNARSSITVPLTIRKLRAAGPRTKSAGGADCGLDAAVEWTLVCAEVENSYSAQITIINKGPDCGTGGGGGGLVGSPGTGERFSHPIVLSESTPCNPCNGNIEQAVMDCLLGNSPIGLPLDIIGAGEDCFTSIVANGGSGVTPCLTAVAVTVIETAIGATPAGAFYDGLKCAKDIAEAACGESQPGTVGPPLGSTYSPSVAKPVNTRPNYELFLLGTHINRVEDILEPIVYLFGSSNLLFDGASPPTLLSNIYLNFKNSISAQSEAGDRISDVELAAISALPRPFHITNEVERLLTRWNRTLDYADAGIYSSTNVPAGSDPDFIASDLMLQKFTLARDARLANEAEGFTNLNDGLQFAIKDLEQQINEYIKTHTSLHLPSTKSSTSLVERRSSGAPASAAAGICAQVKLRLEQTAVITRDGFNATLELVNGSDSSLKNISVQLAVRRSDSTDATSLFAIRDPALSDLSDISGSGEVIPGRTGTASWTIIPTSDAAPLNESVLYFVSGTLRYQQDGVDIVIPLAHAAITVHPSPSLRLKYFHERDVLSDDPFTDEIEPSRPYSLAVMIQNIGFGTARNMRISSGQPKIVENEKGLLIGFDIIATEVAGESLVPSLTANFGNVGPGEIKIGRWLFKSTLQGQFVDYAATFEHTDGLGDPRLSLIESVEIHELIRAVKANNTTDDSLPDFLVNDFTDEHFLPDTLYLSDGSTAPVSPVTIILTAQTPSSTNLSVQLQAALPGGWSYLRVADPSQGELTLLRIVRSDGVELPVENVWVTDRTFIAGGRRPITENNLHLLDFNSTGIYTLFYGAPPATDTLPPNSSISMLPTNSYPNIPLIWSGSDPANGSGVASFDVYVSDNGSAFTPWLAETTLRGSIYIGTPGHTYAFYTRAKDSEGNQESAPASPDAITIVTLVNRAPVLMAGANQTINEGNILTLLNSATDSDPDTAFTFSLGAGSPGGAVIHPSNGTVTWLTGEGSGPSTNSIVIIVTDNGSPQLSATGAVFVVINEFNQPPTLATIANRTVNETALLILQANASDADLPENSLTYSLVGTVPRGLTIQSNTGVLTWTPDSTQGPSTNAITVVVRDNGIPSMSATQRFTITVRNTEGDFNLSIGSTNLLSGETSNVPISIQSSLDITNVVVGLKLNESRLTSLILSPLSARLGSSRLSPAGSNLSELRFTAAPGQVLDIAETLASLSFTSVLNTNTVSLPLELISLEAHRSTGIRLTNGTTVNGRVIIVGNQPFLTAVRGEATLFGTPTFTYSIESAFSLNPLIWSHFSTLTLSNKFQSFGIGDTNQSGLYFRARGQ